MEVWEKEFEWLKVRHIVRDAMKKDTLPDLQTILFLIGVQELGRIPKEKFTKEEKRDLMHVAVCTLLEKDGYFEFEDQPDIIIPKIDNEDIKNNNNIL